jgi:hypothetical protein
VSRGTLILTLIAGALVFLVVLVLYLPASWFASRLPPQMQCGSLGGSVWHGECLGLSVQGAKIGDATWNLSPLAALTGKLSGDVDVRGGAITARSNLRMGLDGSGELTGLEAQVPMDPAISPQFPRDQRGLVVAKLARVVLDAGAQPRVLDGSLELRDFRQVSPRPLELGSYRLTFDGQPRENGVNVGELVDIGGPFGVNGNVTFTPPNNYVIEGLISGRTPEAQGIVREISLGAPPDSSGRNEFSFESSF